MSGGRVPGLDVATSGLLGSHGVFFHHDVTPEMRQLGREALARVDALHLAAKPLNQMSAGERRRMLIARALVTRPEVLLLDEPTTGLDFVARQQFMESVGRLAREGTTILIVTHHIEEVIPETRRVRAAGRAAASRSTARPRRRSTAERLGAVYGAPLEVGKSGGYYHVRVDAMSRATVRHVAVADHRAVAASQGLRLGAPPSTAATSTGSRAGRVEGGRNVIVRAHAGRPRQRASRRPGSTCARACTSTAAAPYTVARRHRLLLELRGPAALSPRRRAARRRPLTPSAALRYADCVVDASAASG